MKIKHFAVVFMAFGITSCMHGVTKKETNAAVKDTLAYTYKTLKQRDPACGNKPDSTCTIVDLKYPEFKNAPALNDSIKHKLLYMFWTDSADVSNDLQRYAKHFISLYEQDTDKDVTAPWEIETNAEVRLQDSSLATIYFSGYSYSGGAHGSGGFYFINWNTKASKTINLNDLFIDGYHDKLTKIAEDLFRKQEKLSDTASLKDNYFFEGGKFALNNNFVITPKGLTFLYNEYEIKSYAEGITRLEIPYTQIKSLLRPKYGSITIY